MKPKLLTINGETRSIRAWSRHVGRPQSTIMLRLSLGWPPEDAVFGEARQMVKIGDRSMTVHAWSRESGAVAAGTIWARLKRGWPAKRAVLEAPQERETVYVAPETRREGSGGMRGRVDPSSLPAPILPRWGGVVSVTYRRSS